VGHVIFLCRNGLSQGRSETVLRPRQATLFSPSLHATPKHSGHGNQEKIGILSPLEAAL